MKIPGTGPTQISTLRRRAQTARTAGAFAGELPTDTGIKEAAPTTDVASVSTLLSVQEMGDSLDNRRRAIKRGEDLLDQLDELRHGLLIGAFSPAKIDNLLSMVRQHQATVTDPKLTEILADIEVRAAVELAKLGKY